MRLSPFTTGVQSRLAQLRKMLELGVDESEAARAEFREREHRMLVSTGSPGGQSPEAVYAAPKRKQVGLVCET